MSSLFSYESNKEGKTHTGSSERVSEARQCWGRSRAEAVRQVRRVVHLGGREGAVYGRNGESE
jgi:hypothetical protein